MIDRKRGPWPTPSASSDDRQVSSRGKMNVTMDGREDTNTGNYDVYMRLARKIAKLPPAEKEAYWRNRERRLAISNYHNRRKPAPITLQKIALRDDDPDNT